MHLTDAVTVSPTGGSCVISQAGNGDITGRTLSDGCRDLEFVYSSQSTAMPGTTQGSWGASPQLLDHIVYIADAGINRGGAAIES